MFFKKSFHQYAENSVVYRHLRDYFNNPVKRKMILNGRIYFQYVDGNPTGFAITLEDVRLYRIYSLILRKLRAVYDDEVEGLWPISRVDAEFAPMVCAAVPHFGWRL